VVSRVGARLSGGRRVARLELRVLGGFDASLEGSAGSVTLPTRKAQALVAYLALSPGQRHPREKLTSLLWGDLRANLARNNLRQALFAVRRALDGVEPMPLRLEADTVTLEPAAVAVDALQFEQAMAVASPPAFQHAVLLYRGDLLAGLRVQSEPFEEWLLAERERLRELALEALARLLVHRRQGNELDAAVQTAVRLLALDPVQEPVHRTLMRLYTRLGRRGAALRQYQACVEVLQKELGLEPEARTRRLYRHILRRAAGTRERSAVVADGDFTVGADTSPARPHLVGRDGELARLRAALEGAQRGERWLTAVLGDAGIGKTRILDEVAVDAARRGFRVLLGRAHETERLLPFGPWLDALHSAPLAGALDGLPANWRTELAVLFPDLATVSPPTDPLEGAGRRILEGMTALLGSLAERGPLLCILEDLHWADEMSLRLLAFASRRLHDRPVLIAVSARTEDLEESRVFRQALEELGRGSRFEAIQLAPLSKDVILSLVLGLLGGRIAPPARRRLAERAWTASEGNPFVAVQTLRAFTADSADGSGAELELPERVRELVRRRLGRLSARGRHVLAVAAVIGREFDFALLAEASGFDDREAAAGVEELVRRGLLRVIDERLEFQHDWLRRVALGDVLVPVRRMLHRGVAEAIETLHTGRLASHALMLGLHFEEARVWAKAVAYLRQAGSQARSRAGYREAVLGFRRALGALGHLPPDASTNGEAVDLRYELNGALVALGEYREALDLLREAERLALVLDDRVRLARILSAICARLRIIGEHTEAIAAGRRAAGLAASLDDRRLEVMIAFRLGQAYLATGEFQQAVGLLRHCLQMEGEGAAEKGPASGRVSAHTWLVRVLTGLGAFEEGIAHGEEAVRRAAAADDPYALTQAQAFLGLLLVARGDLAHAIPLLEQALRMARETDIPDAVASATVALGEAYVLEGRVAEGLPLLEQVVADDVRRGVAHASCVTRLGEGYLRAGRLAEALTSALRALELARTHRERASDAWAHRLAGEIAAVRTPLDVAAAEAGYRSALATAIELGMRPLVAHCHLGLARLDGRRGRPEESRTHLEAAVRLFAEMGMQFWLSSAITFGGELSPVAMPPLLSVPISPVRGADGIHGGSRQR
jgi:DNA-binding SARP family transcriptional activator